MEQSMMDGAISALTEEVSVEIANTPALIRQAYQLRHQVYCVERGFLTGQNGLESDPYDDFAQHAVIRWRQTDVIVGTVRLVRPKSAHSSDNYPIQHLCDPVLLQELPPGTTGELGRFALAKEFTKQVRDRSAASAALLRLALIQGAVRLCAEAEHTHFLAVMEPTLVRLFRSTGVHLIPLGAPVDYHGLRQPVMAEWVPMLARLGAERPAIWNFVTRNGTWYPASRPKVPSLVDGSARWEMAREYHPVPLGAGNMVHQEMQA